MSGSNSRGICLKNKLFQSGHNYAMQTLVIGDIHGCYDELQALLDKAGLTEGDDISSIGDCVVREPDKQV